MDLAAIGPEEKGDVEILRIDAILIPLDVVP
jgi:hypothetical protein